jgi:hypothetical protein
MSGNGRGKRGAASEYDGTGQSDSGTGSAVVTGPSEPIEPDAAAGAGSASSGSPSGRDSAGTEFDATIHSGERNADGTWAKRRGRKRGGGGNSGPRPKASKADLNASIDGLTKVLVILHTGIAGISNTPELVIDEDEGRMLAAATANVMEEFDLKPDPKVQAIVGLVVAAGTVYGPRTVLIQMRKAQEKREKAAGSNGAGTAGVYNADGSAAGTTDFQQMN